MCSLVGGWRGPARKQPATSTKVERSFEKCKRRRNKGTVNSINLKNHQNMHISTWWFFLWLTVISFIFCLDNRRFPQRSMSLWRASPVVAEYFVIRWDLVLLNFIIKYSRPTQLFKFGLVNSASEQSSQRSASRSAVEPSHTYTRCRSRYSCSEARTRRPQRKLNYD